MVVFHVFSMGMIGFLLYFYRMEEFSFFIIRKMPGFPIGPGQKTAKLKQIITIQVLRTVSGDKKSS